MGALTAMKGAQLIAISATLALAACDVAPYVEFRNDSGGPVVLHLPEAGRYARPLDVPLGQGKGRTFRGDALRRDGLYGVTGGQCEYAFEYPRIQGLNHIEFVDERGNSEPTGEVFPLQMQLESDFRLYLLAPGRLKNGVGRPDPTPAHGFPMGPVSKICP